MTADVLIVLGGYLLGSIPFGYVLPRLLRGEDVRRHGSGNVGASNVWRAYGPSLGVPVALLDVAKGLVPALVGLRVGGDWVGVLAGAAAMVGHARPVFLRFSKGGKMVATAGGVALALAPLAARGWAWTAYDWDERRLFNYLGDAQNTFPVWNATPLVALDVYEHAYFLDYQTDRASYVDAFFENLDWQVVNGWIASYSIPF